jgi:ABC-type multidrug transport system fused ATPase/permease subunit
MIGWVINAYVATKRLEKFLKVDNIVGMKPTLIQISNTITPDLQKEKQQLKGTIEFRNANFGWNEVQNEKCEDKIDGCACSCKSLHFCNSITKGYCTRCLLKIWNKFTIFKKKNLVAEYSELEMVDNNSDTDEEVAFEGDEELGNAKLKLKSKTHKDILRNINFHVPAGKLAAIIGPTGCGTKIRVFDYE